MGRSGSGKGTQAKLLIEALKTKMPETSVYHLETGTKFRELIAEGGYSAERAKEVYSRGELIPLSMAVWAWSDCLVKNLTSDKHLFLDGTPRKLQEAEILDGALKFYKREKPVVLLINVSRKWAEERLLARARHDDRADAIKTRLDWYDNDVEPAVEFFRTHKDYQFIDINGEQAIPEVQKEILLKLKW